MEPRSEIQELMDKMLLSQKGRVRKILDTQERLRRQIKGYKAGIERMKKEMIALDIRLDKELHEARKSIARREAINSAKAADLMADMVANYVPPKLPETVGDVTGEKSITDIAFVEVPAGKIDKQKMSSLEKMQADSRQRYNAPEPKPEVKLVLASVPPPEPAKRGRKPKASLDLGKLAIASRAARPTPLFHDNDDREKTFTRPAADYTNIPSPYGIATEMLKEQMKK